MKTSKESIWVRIFGYNRTPSPAGEPLVKMG